MKNSKKVVVVVALVGTLSGCGSVFGVRNFEVWDGGPRWEFAEGQDFHIGANSIDHVQNSRGVIPQVPKRRTPAAPKQRQKPVQVPLPMEDVSSEE